MASTRTLAWSDALLRLHADRVPVTKDERRAHTRREAFANAAAQRARTSILVVAGRYDRAAIMRAAIVAAKARREVTGETWGVCLSAALKGTWQVAKASRLRTSH